MDKANSEWTPQHEEILSALRVFVPEGQLTELRAFDPDRNSIHNTVYRDHRLMVRRAVELDSRTPHASGIYFIPNEIRPDFVAQSSAYRSKSATADDIFRRKWLLVDVDPFRFDEYGQQLKGVAANVATTDEEKGFGFQVVGSCIQTLEGFGFAGHVLGDSGNGWHLCYPIDLPNDSISYRLIARTLAELHDRCAGNLCIVDQMPKDAPRIWKLYGTVARKGDGVGNRPWRYSWLLEQPGATPQIRENNNASLKRVVELWDHQATVKRQLAGRATVAGQKASAIERARAYIEKEDPAISGSNGHKQCYHVACILIHGFSLSASEAFTAITTWNARCQPPWSEKELQHKFDDASKDTDHKEPRGYLLNQKQETNDQSRAGGKESATPELEDDGSDSATLADVAEYLSSLEWVWPGWIQQGALVAIASDPGIGKTRLCMDLIRRIRHGMPWPDGQPMTLAPDTTVIYLPCDHQHAEMMSACKGFGIDPATVVLNAPKRDPFGGLDLDMRPTLNALTFRIETMKPSLVIVDTIGNATERNLCRAEEAKRFFGELMPMALRHKISMVLVTHLNASGGTLGRRLDGSARQVIKMEVPDPENQPNRRRLWVAKSNSKYPPALGVTMGDAGNEYDDKPPVKPEDSHQKRVTGKTDTKRHQSCEWLREQLVDGPKRVSLLRSEGEGLGFTPRDIYHAKDVIGVEEFSPPGSSLKWWRIPTKAPEKEDESMTETSF